MTDFGYRKLKGEHRRGNIGKTGKKTKVEIRTLDCKKDKKKKKEEFRAFPGSNRSTIRGKNKGGGSLK